MREEYDFSSGKRDAVIAPAGKTRIMIMLDDDIIEFFRNRAAASGMGYQTTINAALRAFVADGVESPAKDEPIAAPQLRKILREELKSI